MKIETIKAIVDNESDAFANIEMVGIIICDHCFQNFLLDNEDFFENLPEDFGIFTTNILIGKQSGGIMIGKMLETFDENKSLKDMKKEVREILDSMGLLHNDIEIWTKGVVFLSGVLLHNFDEDEQTNNDNEYNKRVKKEIDNLLGENNKDDTKGNS